MTQLETAQGRSTQAAVSTAHSPNLRSLKNHLIQLLPRPHREHLLSLCQQVPLYPGEVLCERGTKAEFAYFPTEGFISLLADGGSKPSLEVALVGFEGMLGIELALDVAHTPLQAVVRRAGMAWRVSAEALGAELAREPALQRVLKRYALVLINQLGIHSACLRFHLIEQRLARWLLMGQDRARADRFHVTHESLAALLGVRRVSITTTAGALQRDGLIKYQHGEVTVVDRKGLQARVCACYAADQAVYTKVLSSGAFRLLL